MNVDACAWLESQQGPMVSDLIELSNQNSGSGNLPGLLRVADWLEDWMDLRDTRFERIHLPPRRMVNDEGDELAFDAAPALRWDFQPSAERRVLLAIHYDTVFSPLSPFQECELISSDKLQGPGVADAKGGIVLLRYALKALTESSLAHDCGWTVLLNPDEEIGSPSSAQLFQDIAPEFDFGLLFEPALPTGELVSERKGSGNFDIVVRGKAAHAGRDFEAGRNAVGKLCELLSGLAALNGLRPGVTINIGAVRGGSAVNIVPDTAVGRVNVRVNDSASGDWFVEHLEQAVSGVNHQPGFRCQRFGGLTSPPKPITDAMRQLMLGIENAAMASGQPPIRWKSTGGVCDGNKLAAAGLANIDTLGPVGDGLHSTSEWVQPSSLVQKAKLLVSLINRFSSGEFQP